MCLAQYCIFFETIGGGSRCVSNPLLVSRNAISRVDPGQDCPTTTKLGPSQQLSPPPTRTHGTPTHGETPPNNAGIYGMHVIQTICRWT